jgi:hypothetical protein
VSRLKSNGDSKKGVAKEMSMIILKRIAVGEVDGGQKAIPSQPEVICRDDERELRIHVEMLRIGRSQFPTDRSLGVMGSLGSAFEAQHWRLAALAVH